jgi:hypothetical protein
MKHANVGKTVLIAETSSGTGTAFARPARKETMMVKKMLTLLIVGILLAVLVTACGVKEASPAVIPTVHMGALGFIQDSITFHKGEMLEFERSKQCLSFYRPIAPKNSIATCIFASRCSLYTIRTLYAAHEGV